MSGGGPSVDARELEVLRLVAAGSTNGDIARKLWVTEQTVKFHLSNVYRKLGLANRTEIQPLRPCQRPGPPAVRSFVIPSAT